MAEIKLTEFSHGSGCGCKIAPAVLQKLLADDGLRQKYPGLIVGNESMDDAAVYQIDNGDQLIISTVDFFTPIVNDAFDFGRIAAANALSDIYAMGGTPVFATAILGFPVEKITVETVRKILEGGRKVCGEAGIPVAGGHSIDCPEPFFGLSVNGIVDKKDLKRNNTAKGGDLLYITKPIGTGIIAAAVKRGVASMEHERNTIELMTQLNRVGARLGKMAGVNALTDITGFGLLGHLTSMAEGSNCSAELYINSIPLIPGIEDYTKQSIFPDNVYRNWNAYEQKVTGVSGPEFIMLCDPQTSGGLLVSLSPESKDDFLDLMKEEKINAALEPIGKMTEKREFVIRIII